MFTQSKRTENLSCNVAGTAAPTRCHIRPKIEGFSGTFFCSSSFTICTNHEIKRESLVMGGSKRWQQETIKKAYENLSATNKKQNREKK
jgi:hypothetical protein